MSRHKVKVIITAEYVINTTLYGVTTIEDAMTIDKVAYERGEIGLDALLEAAVSEDAVWEAGEEIVEGR